MNGDATAPREAEDATAGVTSERVQTDWGGAATAAAGCARRLAVREPRRSERSKEGAPRPTTPRRADCMVLKGKRIESNSRMGQAERDGTAGVCAPGSRTVRARFAQGGLNLDFRIIYHNRHDNHSSLTFPISLNNCAVPGSNLTHMMLPWLAGAAVVQASKVERHRSTHPMHSKCPAMRFIAYPTCSNDV